MPDSPLKLLLVDDDKNVVMQVHHLLADNPDARIKPEWANTLRRGRELFAERRHDVYAVGLHLRDGNGLDLVRLAATASPPAPILVLARPGADEDSNNARMLGATDVLRSEDLSGPLLAQAIRYAVERSRLLADSLRSHATGGEERVKTLERELAEARRKVLRLENELTRAFELLAASIESRGPYSRGDRQRVAHLAAAIATRMGLEQPLVDAVYMGGLIHDIGNIALPHEVISRPDRLTPPELTLTRTHARAGYDLLKGLGLRAPLAEMCRQHHERLDGSGYPDRLRGEAIHLPARILAVADMVASMTADRPYRKALPLSAALQEIARLRGTALDAEAVDACFAVCQEKY